MVIAIRDENEIVIVNRIEAICIPPIHRLQNKRPSEMNYMEAIPRNPSCKDFEECRNRGFTLQIRE